MKILSLYSHHHADRKTKQNSVEAFSVTAEVDGEFFKTCKRTTQRKSSKSLQARRSQTDFVRHHFHP